MTLEEAIQTTDAHLGRMNELYGHPVFNEWAIVSIDGRKARILHYFGPRREDLQNTMSDDLRDFANDLIAGQKNIGDFDFSRHASGTHFDAYVVLGEGCYLVCNNTTQSMAGITRNQRWLKAQVPFAELSDTFRSNPLIHPF